MQGVASKALKGVAGGIIGIGTAAVAAGSQFETSFAKVSTMFGDVNVDTDNLKSKIKELSNETGIAANELNEGLYSALSAGIPATEDMGEAMDFLATSTTLAKGGFTTTEKSVDALSTVLNGYKMETKDAAKVADILLMTQNKGKTTVDELASSIAQVTPTAAAMNVEFEQVAAALATMTAQGVPTAQATTMLNTMLSELGKSGQQANENLMAAAEGTEYAGMSFQEMMEKGVPLNEVLDMMSDYAEANGKSLIDMFGSVEAGKAALQMAGQNADTYTKNLEAMKDAEGAAAEAAEKMNGTFGVLANRIKATVSNKLVDIYDQYADKINEAATAALEFIENIDPTEIIPTLTTVAGVLAGIYATVTALRGAIALNSLATSFNAVSASAGGLSGMISAFTANIGTMLTTIAPIVGIIAAIVAAIALVVATITDLWNTNELFKASVLNAIQSIQDTMSLVWETILKPIFDNLKQVLLSVYENGIKPLWDSWTEFIGNIIIKMTELWEVIKPIVDWFVQTFGPTLVNVFNTVANVFGSVVTTIMNVAGALLGNIGEVIGGIIDFFKGIIEFLEGVFTGNWEKIWQGLVDMVSGIFSALLGIVKAPINGVIGLINGVIGAINSISIDIPDWVPLVGGSHFGLSIPTIPYLEKGGILKKGQVGLLEGNGAEAVVPLEKNKAWIRAVAKDMVQIIPQVAGGGFQQTNNFYQKVETPAEYARAMRIQARYGLAGVKI